MRQPRVSTCPLRLGPFEKTGDFVGSCEEVAIGIIGEQQASYNEGGSFTLTKFDGTTVMT